MKGSLHAFRTAAKQEADKLVPAIDSALKNEQITRQRVDRLEAFLELGFWGRLRWLILGLDKPLARPVVEE